MKRGAFGVLCLWALGIFTMQADAVVASIPADMTGNPGGIVSVPINLDNAAHVVSYFFEVKFDAAAFDYVDATNGPLPTSAGWGPPLANNVADSVFVAAAEVTALTGGGTVVVLDFHVKPGTTPGFYPFTMQDSELNGGLIPSTKVNGQAEIAYPVPSLLIPSFTDVTDSSASCAIAASSRRSSYGWALVLVWTGLALAVNRRLRRYC